MAPALERTEDGEESRFRLSARIIESLDRAVRNGFVIIQAVVDGRASSSIADNGRTSGRRV
jgi:hypothetical protein